MRQRPVCPAHRHLGRACRGLMRRSHIRPGPTQSRAEPARAPCAPSPTGPPDRARCAGCASGRVLQARPGGPHPVCQVRLAPLLIAAARHQSRAHAVRMDDPHRVRSDH
jgi:hypothetical protein